MATKTPLIGRCSRHGEFPKETTKTACPSCEDPGQEVKCPRCQLVIEVASEDEGEFVECPGCGTEFDVCDTCKEGYTGGDGYNGECPDCADRTEARRQRKPHRARK